MPVLHIDLDAFFAACEERERPELKGLPLVIGADPKGGKGRGVVSTANYEARKYGIHSGMPISKAYRLCQAANFLPVNFQLYYKVSGNVMKILRKYAEKFQQVSIDEAFLDMGGHDYSSAMETALKIQDEIEKEEKITCSAGIGPNKLIAKMASDMQKPKGLAIIRQDEVKQLLSPFPVRKLYGVGKKTEAALKALGIETIGELADYDVQALQGVFGKWGTELHFYANGIDESEVEETEGIQSVGRECTFGEDTDDVSLLYDAIDAMAEDVSLNLKEESLSCKTIAIKIRYENFETHTSQKTFSGDISDAEIIGTAAKDLLKKFTESKKKIRLVGVRATNLQSTGRQKSLGEFFRN